MPWPMRLGPPPRMTIFSRSSGRASSTGAAREGRRVGRIHVGGGRGELGRAGVDALVDRLGRRAPGAQPSTSATSRPARAASRASEKPALLRARRLPGPVAGRPKRLHLGLEVDDVLHLLDEPGVEAAGLVDLGVAHAVAQRLGDVEHAIRRRPAERGPQRDRFVALARGPRWGSRRGRSGRSPASAAPSAALSAKVRPIAMASPTDFMAVVSIGSAPGNFSKAKRGILVTT